MLEVVDHNMGQQYQLWQTLGSLSTRPRHEQQLLEQDHSNKEWLFGSIFQPSCLGNMVTDRQQVDPMHDRLSIWLLDWHGFFSQQECWPSNLSGRHPQCTLQFERWSWWLHECISSHWQWAFFECNLWTVWQVFLSQIVWIISPHDSWLPWWLFDHLTQQDHRWSHQEDSSILLRSRSLVPTCFWRLALWLEWTVSLS